MTTTNTGCNDCNPCNDCQEPEVPKTCSIKLDTSCVIYNVLSGTPSLLTGLNLQNGTTLTEILNAIDSKLNGLTGYNVPAFNLGQLKNEYDISDLQDAIEALANKTYSNTNRIIQLEGKTTDLTSSLGSLRQMVENPQLNPLYPIIVDGDESLKEAIEKIVNHLGAMGDNGGSGTGSPRLQALNSNTIAFSTSGPLSHTLTGNVVISPDATNLLKIKSSGLYVEPSKQTISYDPQLRRVCLSNNGGCFILPLDNTGSGTDSNPLVALNSDTIEFVTSGTNGHTITAQVNIQSVLNAIADNPTLRAQFCNICSLDPCTGQVITPSWIDTTETRCSGTTLEKKQKDNNRCSTTYNGIRWVTSQANSLLCGYQALAYCVRYNCATKACQSTETTHCQSAQICLVNNVTNQTIAAAEDIEVFYTLTQNGVVSQKSFTLTQGLVSAEGPCHCGPIGTVITVGNFEIVGQVSNNSGLGYAVCSDTPVQGTTPVTPVTPVAPVTPVTPGPTTPTGPTNSIALVQNCTNYTITASGEFYGLGTRTMKVYKDNVLIATRTVNTNTFTEVFTGVVGGNKYYVSIVEDGNVTNQYISNEYVSPCVTQVNIAASAACADKSISASGSMGDATSVNLSLVKEGVTVQTKTVTGPNYTTKFFVVDDGYYYVEAIKAGQVAGKVTSNVAYLSCVTSPVSPAPTPQSNTININNVCSANTITVLGNVVNSTRVLVHLYRNDVLVDTLEDTTGPNIDVTFTNIINGTYKAIAKDANDATNTITSQAITITCSTVTSTTTPVAPTKSITLSQSCTTKRIAATVSFPNTNGVGLTLFKGDTPITTSSNVYGDSFTWNFDNINESGDYTVRVFELNNDVNTITSSVFTYTCANPVTITPTTPSPTPAATNTISTSHDCALKQIAVDVTFYNTSNGSAVVLFKDNIPYRTTQGRAEPRYIVAFNDLIENGTYRAEVFEPNNDPNRVASGDMVFTCNNAPAPAPTYTPVTPTPAQPDVVSISGDCALQQINVDVKYTSPNGSIVKLYLNDQLIRTSQVRTETAYITVFSGLTQNGTYKAFVQDPQQTTGLTTSTVQFTCNNTPAPVTPTPAPCQRPSGLNQVRLGYNYVDKPSGEARLFTSKEEACLKTYAYFNNGDVSGISSFDAQSVNMEVGTLIYAGSGTSCDLASANYYTVLDYAGNNNVKKAIRVGTDGKISEVIDCIPVTPAPAPSNSTIVVQEGDGQLNTGAAAINFIVEGYNTSTGNTMVPYDYDVFLQMTTGGLVESGRTIKCSPNASERFMGGTTVSDSLALMSKGHTALTGAGLWYYSAAINVNKLKEKYPNQEIVEFELSALAKTTSGQKVSRINGSAFETEGIVPLTQENVQNHDYDYSSYPNRDTGVGHWLVYQQSGQNTVPQTRTPWVKCSVNLNTRRTTFTLLRGYYTDNNLYPQTKPQTFTI